jgi:hypothetical protein
MNDHEDDLDGRITIDSDRARDSFSHIETIYIHIINEGRIKLAPPYNISQKIVVLRLFHATPCNPRSSASLAHRDVFGLAFLLRTAQSAKELSIKQARKITSN